MIIEETCPKCGKVLIDEIITTYPPIPRKRCFACGWSWIGEREEIVRVPFDESVKKAEKIIYDSISNVVPFNHHQNASACIHEIISEHLDNKEIELEAEDE